MEDLNITSLPIVNLAGEYLRARGLNPEECIALGGRYCTSGEVIRMLGWQPTAAGHYQGGLWLPGRSPAGFEVEGYGHAILWKRDGERARYCPAGANQAVFMPVPEQAGGSWDTLDPTVPVIICESWLKAAVACLSGFAAIALNGVDGWSSGNRTLIESLRSPRFDGQRVAVVFDSLSKTNERSRTNVARAVAIVQAFLHDLGAVVMDIRVPEPVDRDQWGLDDWVASVGRIVFAAAVGAAQEVDERELNALNASLHDLNSRFTVVKDLDKVVSLEDPTARHTPAGFKLAYAPLIVRVPVGDKVKNMGVADVWLTKWEHRNTHDRLCFLPGAERVVGSAVNLWNGFTAAPADDTGDVLKFWVGTLMEMFPDGADELLDILALLVQRPDVKPGRYLFVMGKPGTGKNFVFNLVERLLGAHCVRMTPERYAQKFNLELAAARMIYVSEVPSKISDRDKDNIVAEIKMEADTAPGYRRMEPKGGETIRIERNALLVMLSNYSMPWELEDGDRRGLILRTTDGMALRNADHPWGTKDGGYWKERWDWALGDAAVPELHRFLLNYPVCRERLERAPTQTAAKSWLESKYLDTGWEGWARKVMHHPEPEWDVGRNRFILAKQACQLKHLGSDKPYVYTSGDGQSMGQHLSQEGALVSEKKIKINGSTTRVFMLRGSNWNTDEVRMSVNAWDKILTEGVA